jgi:hypothetical protein
MVEGDRDTKGIKERKKGDIGWKYEKNHSNKPFPPILGE